MMRHLLVISALLLLGFVYLYPGTKAFVEGRTDTFMSDGTDPTGLPYAYDLLKQTWVKNPSYFFHGSVYFDSGDPERGIAYWVPWNERWTVMLLSPFFPVEQLSTGFIWLLLVTNGFCMWLLARYLGWPVLVSFALAMAWAFNAYTRARAKVHGALAGIYHLPLIFLGLFLVVRGKSWRSLVAAMAAFLFAATVAHYYLVTSIFLSPLFILFLFMQPEFFKGWKKISLRFAAAVVPAMLFLGWNYLHPLPESAKMSNEASMVGDAVKEGEVHPFLGIFYAKAVDLLAGDITLEPDGLELNPLRAFVNDYVLGDLGISNSHERTNGIRWIILALALAALVAWSLGRYRQEIEIQRNLFFFVIFALFTFWMAAGPGMPLAEWGPSYWLYTWMPKIRVSSRAMINAHFAILMMAGFFLATLKWGQRFRYWSVALVALVILDYPPLQSMPMARVMPSYKHLHRSNGPCGVGMAFPFVSFYSGQGDYYYLMQRLRESGCSSLNQMTDLNRLSKLSAIFPPDTNYLVNVDKSALPAEQLYRLAKCVPLNWIAFLGPTPKIWALDLCRRLGWTMYDDMTCIAPNRNQPLASYGDECL